MLQEWILKVKKCKTWLKNSSCFCKIAYFRAKSQSISSVLISNFDFLTNKRFYSLKNYIKCYM